MKKLIVLLSISMMTIGAIAKEPLSGVGIQLGYTQTDIWTNSWEGEKAKDLTNHALNGFKVGLTWDATYIKGFGSMLGINYTFGIDNGKWASLSTAPNAPIYPQHKSQDIYQQLELFVDWQYKIEIAGNTYVILYTGPTIQCQLALSHKVFERDVTQVDKMISHINRYDIGEAPKHEAYQRMNVTWGLGLGFQYDRYYIRGGYDFGLINPYKIGNFNESETLKSIDRYTRGRVDQWSIKLGIFFAQFGK